MNLPILTNVKSELVTQRARYAATVVLVSQTGIQLAQAFGWLDTQKAATLVGLVTGAQFEASVAVILAFAAYFLPAGQGWRSADKELPAGLTTKDVIIPPAYIINANRKEGNSK